jgi:hypothetical protein
MMIGIAVFAVEAAFLPLPLALICASLTPAIALLEGPLRLRNWPRFLIVNLVVVSVTLVLIGPMFSVRRWVAQTSVSLTFLVVDSSGQQPIGTAVVRIIDANGWHPPVEVTTEPDGSAELNSSFRTSRSYRPFEDTGTVSFGNWWFEVSAPGYTTVRRALPEVTGTYRDYHDPNPPPIRVGLTPARHVEQGPFLDLAGDYFRGDSEFGGSLTLEADGRYSGVLRNEQGIFEQSKGTVRSREGCLILEPATPSNSKGYFPTELVPFRWASRLYLIPKDEVPLFSEAVKRGDEPRDRAHGSAFLREGDWTKKVGPFLGIPEELRSLAQPQPDRDGSDSTAPAAAP